MASFILVSAFVVFAALLQGFFDSSTQTQLKTKAAIVASNQLARIRDWSRQSTDAHPNFDILAAHFNGTINDPDWPLYKITTTISTPAMFSPCSELEKVNTVAPNVHNMSSTYRKILLDISWDTIDPTRKARFATLLGSPARAVNTTTPVVVTALSGIPSTVPSSGCAVTFKAELIDDRGVPIPDVSFHWNVWPVTSLPGGVGGDGSVVGDNNGFTATYNCVFTGPDGSSQVVPNSDCVVRAVVQYHGKEYYGDSANLHTGP